MVKDHVAVAVALTFIAGAGLTVAGGYLLVRDFVRRRKHVATPPQEPSWYLLGGGATWVLGAVLATMYVSAQ